MIIYSKLRKLFFKLYFHCQKRIVPYLSDSQYRYIETLLALTNKQVRWLDLGCGHRIVPAWTGFEETRLSGEVKFLVGMDRDAGSLKRHKNLSARVVADVNALPFRAGSFNLVTANMVVEHLEEPDRNLNEIFRVLEPKGLFVFHTVNILHYNALISSLLPRWLKIRLVKFLENRREEDVYPTHYRLNTLDSIATAASRAQFKPLYIAMVNSSPEMIMLGPIVIFELLLIRLLERGALAKWRSNIIATLQRPLSAETESNNQVLLVQA